jgi:hypothetical protein
VDDRFEPLAMAMLFAAHPLREPGRLQGVMEFVDMDRLEEIVLHPGAQALRQVVILGAGGHHDDGDLRPALLYFVNQPRSSLAGHVQVGHHDRREVLFQECQRSLRRGRRLTIEME